MSLAALPLSEPGRSQLRLVHPASSELPAPGSGDERGPAPANSARHSCHLPVAPRAPLTRLPKDGGGAHESSQSKEGSSPAQRHSIVCYDPELQKHHLPSFPIAALIYFGTLTWSDVEIVKLAIKVVIWCLSVSSSFLENAKSIQKLNILALFPALLLAPRGLPKRRARTYSQRQEGPRMLTQPWLTSAEVRVARGPGTRAQFRWGPRGLHPEVHSAHGGPSGHVALSQKPLCPNPSWLLPLLLLSSLCVGPGDLLDPFRPLPGPALPLHLDAR